MSKTLRFYVVWRGRRPGIMTSWDETQRQVDRYPNARFKSFRTLPDAEAAYAAGPPDLAGGPTRKYRPGST
ncbi:MAG: RNase H1/viroplasmin domain-containing protein [Hyphomicrobiaceae bacterium]|nr:RNase H1/viroplasmin domain-containing protein [Hyphomicrobiaceae bacterium]